MNPPQRKLQLHRDRWERQSEASDPVAAAHLVHQGQPVDCYDQIAEEYAHRLNLGSTDRVLEVGCGSGCLLSRMAPRVSEVVGTDFSAGMLAHLRDSGIEAHCCEARVLPFPDHSFDKVYCHSVVQYFPDEAYAATAVSEMLRVCRPGGRVLVGDVINGLLRQDYLRAERRSSSSPLRRAWQVLKRRVLQPLRYRWKYGGAVDPQPLCLSPFFFKQLLNSTPHVWWPLLETVETKPLPFITYRYDVLVEKDALRRDAPPSVPVRQAA